MRKTLYLGMSLAMALTSCQKKGKELARKSAAQKPNILLIYFDDLGYGDIGANGATALKTPNFDALAAHGQNFRHAYATSATSTPSRYGLMTGEYPWRKGARILPGDAPLLIDTAQVTLPKMLRQQGYTTAVIGKWHLGMGNGRNDWNARISPGPNEVGFDYAHVLAATQDRVPTVYIENGQVVGLDPQDSIFVSYSRNFEGEPTALDNPELVTMPWDHGHNNSIVNGIPRIGFMKGGQKARWSDVDMADHFLSKVKAFLGERKEDNTPFFLAYNMQQPHVPRTPHPRFVGASGMGPRGDVILEADWCIGELMQTLRQHGLEENTLVILSSDNGPVLNDGYKDQAVELLGDHRPAGPLRGGKYSLFDAGTHVPFITYWKGKIKPGVSDALVCQIDLLSSLANLTGSEVRTPDSEDVLPALLGRSEQGRESVVLEATGRTFYRAGDWVLIPPYKGPAVLREVNIELGNSPAYGLYQLSKDPGQERNLAQEHPEKLQEMIQAYQKAVAAPQQ